MTGRETYLLKALEQTYGIPCDRVTVMDSAEHRLVAKVLDACGRRFVLKNRPPWITAPDFRAILALQEQAVGRGARIPAVARTAEGDLTWRWNGIDLGLHAWIEGIPLGRSENQALALGAAVGRFSVATGAMDAAQAGDWAFPSGRARWLPDRFEDLRSVGRFLSELDLPATTAAAIAEVLEQGHVNPESLPSGFIHGDVSPLNAVWDGGVATLIDLDEMRWGYRLFDAAHGVATVAGFDWGAAGPTVRTRWELGRACAFLTGWSREARPTPAEAEAFDAYLKLTLVRVVVGELDLDDPALPTRSDAAKSVGALLSLLRAPVPALVPRERDGLGDTCQP